MDCIMNFIALGAISEIDDYYAAALPYCPLKKALEDPLIIDSAEIKIKFRDRNKIGKFLRMLYKLYRIVYSSVYYYFIPYLAVVMTYLVGGLND